MSSLAGRKFPNWIQAYIQYTKDSEAPDTFHFWTAASVLAGALRRRVWIDQRYFQWTPNLYVVFVAPPGIATKSTSVNIGMQLLREVEGVHFGPNSLTWQGLTLALEEAKDHIDLGVDDEGMPAFQPMSCLTIPISELGTFLKPQDTDLVDLLVDLWDGQKTVWRHKTKTTGEQTIINPWMNIIGCVTPAWLRQNFPMYVIEGGLTSRMIFVFAERKRQYVAYPSSVINGKAFQDVGRALVDDLRFIAQFQGEYTLDTAALEWGEQWYKAHWSKREGTTISERFSGYLSRKQTHIHKLALILAAAKSNDPVITAGDLIAAERVVTGLEADLEKVFNTIGIQTVGRNSNDVLAVIQNNQPILESDLMRTVSQTMDHRQLQGVLMTLITSRQIEKVLMNAAGGGITFGYKAIVPPPGIASSPPDSPLIAF